MSHADPELRRAYLAAYRTRPGNREIQRKREADFYARNKKLISVRNNEYRRQRQTGWTAAQYNAAFVEQDGRCALCTRHALESERPLHADHCHGTRTKRKLLCMSCNLALGLFRDDPSLMRRAAAYVEQYAPAGEQAEIKEIQCPTK